MTKTCNICGHIGEAETDFPRGKGYAGGYRPYCKPCHNKAAVKWQKDNPEKFAVIQKKHLATDKRKATQQARHERIKANPVAWEKKLEMTRVWRNRMREEGKLDSITFRNHLNRYNLTTEQYNTTLERQNHVCAICKQPKLLIIDHDHRCCPGEKRGEKSCGKCVRGLLCINCNTALGKFHDSPELLQAAIDYLAQW